MISQDLINQNLNIIQAIHEGRVTESDEAVKLYELLYQTNEAYTSLTEQNAELQKELAKLKGDRVFVVNNEEGEK